MQSSSKDADMKTVLGPSAANPDAAGNENLDPGSEIFPL
jgi:hypothetical protein